MRIDDKSVDIQLGSEKSQNSITAETGSSSVLSDNKINDSVEENNDNLVDVTTGNVENKVNDNDTLKYSLTEEIDKSRRFTVPEEYYSFFSRVGIDFEVAIEILASANTVCSLYVLVQIFGNSEIPQKLSWHSVGENDIRNNKTVLMKYELSKSLYAELFQAVRSNRVSIKGNLENLDISFFANKSKRLYSCVYDCMEVPGIENQSDKMLHWSFSLNDKQNIVDIDIFCKLSELYNRIIEKPEGNRNIINIVEGGTGFGEIKLYRKNKKAIEQIEHAKLTKVICEFGKSDIYIS